MSNEIESVKPAISVVIDDGDFIINSTGPIGKAMAQAVLPLVASAKKVVVISDGEMKVMKRNPAAENQAQIAPAATPQPARRPSTPIPASDLANPDIAEKFYADLEAGITGEAATGEAPSLTPGPNDPVVVPKATKRRPQIFQDAAAPPAPELAEAEMDRLLQEAQQAEQEVARVAEDRRFQQQQAVQAGNQEAEAVAEPPARTRKREPRALATTGRPCGRCGGAGAVMGDAGFSGACPVCHGEGQVKTWDRSLKVR